MCGIVGYIGDQQAAPILLAGLAKLEYRGYDSAGISVRNETNGEIEVVKAKGRLKTLIEKTDEGHSVYGSCGIGHTRWATHGEPSETNAHPHCSEGKNVVLVHNGIIENFQELKEKLVKRGYTFYSETDTEVAVKLIDYYYKKTASPVSAIATAMLHIRGSYAFGVLFKDYPDKLFAARKDSPLIIGKTAGASLIASDVPAILDQTRNVYYIDNMEIAELTRDEIHFFNTDEEEIEKEMVEIKWDAEAAEKGGYEHFMLKEIHEQPKAVQDTIGAYLKGNQIDFSEIGLEDEELASIERFYIIGCGSAYHVAMAAKYVLEDMTQIPVEIDIASEFRYRNPILVKNSLVVIISQSGETADSLAALRMAKERGVKTLGIVNVVGSSIAREADKVMYTWAGPEIAVATTKAYSAQLVAQYLLAIKFAQVRGKVTEAEVGEMLRDLKKLPDQVEMLLSHKEKIQKFANRFIAAKDIFFIGRGIDYAISMEGSLKLKEISYIHSEAYAAGELKHGTISLIEDGTPVVAVATQDALLKKTISNIVEVKTRGAFVMAVTNEGNTEIEKTADYVIYIPQTNAYFANSLAIIPLQLFSYYVAVGKGCDVDKPRNLAKSVTVE